MQLLEILNDCLNQTYLSLDTETTGLDLWHGDRIIGIAISTPTKDYYINFKDYENEEYPHVQKEDFYEMFASLFLDKEKTWFLFNAKFDLHMLSHDHCFIAGDVIDLRVNERLLDNLLFPNQMSLAATAKRYGLQKSEAVTDWLNETKNWEYEYKVGSKTKSKKYFWNLVPPEILIPYAKQDSRITFQIGMRQLAKFKKIEEDQAGISNNLQNIVNLEKRLIKTVFHMEHHGVLIDTGYCEEAICHYEDKSKEIYQSLSDIAGTDFIDSAKFFKEKYPELITNRITKKANVMCFDSEALEEVADTNKIAGLIVQYRHYQKYLQYFHNFLNFIDSNNILHAEFDQAGTKTGRFSSKNPNFQNLTKNDFEESYPIRRAIKPRPGTLFVMLDYDQQEYRMMLDYAGASDLIKKVAAGLDVHEATAQIAKIARSQAKGANFATLYGSGIITLAKNLGVNTAEAKRIKDAILNAAPEIGIFIRRATDKARINGQVRTWAGRILRFPEEYMDKAYRAPNGIIQGGCADVMKAAMNQIDSYLTNKNTRLVGTIHDEVILEVLPREKRIVRDIKDILENTYFHKTLRLTCSVEYSSKSLADKDKWEW